MSLPMSIQASNTDASKRENRQDQSGEASGLRQYGAITLASGGSTASASASAESPATRWLWIGLAVVAAAALWLILRGR